ncbi:hypothetical protein ATCR1_23900 [Agrobacterium tumefaciens CCNWGS0286]|nr:hypothetical protein ATCR1_23900 [Agrobacterium tumefaciens CCNWGS0286]
MTPMHEANPRRHMSEQTSLPIHQLNLVDIEDRSFPNFDSDQTMPHLLGMAA